MEGLRAIREFPSVCKFADPAKGLEEISPSVRPIVRPSVQDRAVLGLMWTQVGQRLNSDMAATAALTMFLELMDDDGLFVTAK